MKYLSLCFCLIFLLYCRNVSNNSTNITDTIKTTKKEEVTIRIVDTTVIGTAIGDFKGSPFVRTDTCAYYLDTINIWDENINGEIVKVSGKLLVQDFDPKETDPEKTDSEEIDSEEIVELDSEGDFLEQRVYGIKYTILNPKWELVDTTRKKRRTLYK